MQRKSGFISVPENKLRKRIPDSTVKAVRNIQIFLAEC